jgi:hypothetical protein
MSEVRPRYAYRVAQVTATDRNVRWDQAAKAEARQLKINVDRIAASSVPQSARIHPWKWDKREVKGSLEGRRT